MDKNTVILESKFIEIFNRKVEITLREINVKRNNRAVRFFIREVKK